MSVVIAMLLACVLLGLMARRPDRRTTLAMALVIAAYISYAYVSG